jgi:hypothetical protein
MSEAGGAGDLTMGGNQLMESFQNEESINLNSSSFMDWATYGGGAKSIDDSSILN